MKATGYNSLKSSYSSLNHSIFHHVLARDVLAHDALVSKLAPSLALKFLPVELMIS
jgi:hypothetical protein